MASAICAAMSERAADFSIKDAPRRSSSVQQRTNPFAKDARTKQQQQPTYQPVFVEVLQQRYLLLEDAMWSVIVSGLEQSYVLQQIHNGYQTFFLGNITVYNAYLSTFDPHQSVIYEAMNAINQSAAETVHRYLQASSHAFSERDALAISVRNQNLTYQLDTLFDKMANTDFLTIVRNVSVFVAAIIYAVDTCATCSVLLRSRHSPWRSGSLCLCVVRDVRGFMVIGVDNMDAGRATLGLALDGKQQLVV